MTLKKILLIIGAIAVTANTATADELTVRITGIEAARGGTVSVMIFGKDGYPKKHAKALEIKTLPVAKGEMVFTFRTERNHVAVKVHHDEDGDSKVTKNWTGIYPAEGLGFSNQQHVSLTGPPSYRKSKIRKDNFDKTIEIVLRYGKKKK